MIDCVIDSVIDKLHFPSSVLITKKRLCCANIKWSRGDHVSYCDCNVFYVLEYLFVDIHMEYTSKEVYEFVSKQTNDPIVERRICRVS